MILRRGRLILQISHLGSVIPCCPPGCDLRKIHSLSSTSPDVKWTQQYHLFVRHVNLGGELFQAELISPESICLKGTQSGLGLLLRTMIPTVKGCIVLLAAVALEEGTKARI